MSDRIFGGIGLLLSIFYIWQATVIQESPFSDVIGPKVFPYMIGVLLGVSSLYMLVRPDANPNWPPAGRMFEIGMAIAAMVAYALALPQVGFLIATTLASAYLSWRLGTSPHAALIAGVLTALAIYLLFHKILGLSLAKSALDGYVDAVIDPVGSALGRAIDAVGSIFSSDAPSPVDVPAEAPATTGATGQSD